MAGLIWFKKGRHWTRLPGLTEMSAETNAELISDFLRLTDYQIKKRGLWRMLHAVALACHHNQEATRRAATSKDAEAQLKAMLKLDDASLAKAIEDCDTGTLAAISAAQNAMHFDPETKWVACNDHYIPGAEVPVLDPDSVRRSVKAALANVQMQKGRPGRKEKPYQGELARACVEVWRECRQPMSRGRVEFARAAFEAAGMCLGDKQLETLLAKVKLKRV